MTLRPVDAGLTAIGVEADDNGNFAMFDIAPGRYTFLAERDGYLESSTSLHGTLRMPQIVFIESNQRLTRLTFRLRPWAIIAGKISFEDAEPGVGVRVEAYREYHQKGRHGFQLAASVLTDDRGEYRLHGLQPGAYFVAAVYESAASAPGYREESPRDANGRALPLTGYTTTFYPNMTKLSEAVGVRLDYGKELLGIDIRLHKVGKAILRGRISSGVTGEIVSGATIFLQRTDAQNVGAMNAPAPVTYDRFGWFEIHGVTPGPYLITAQGASGNVRLEARDFITVAEHNITNIEMLMLPELAGRAKIRGEGPGDLDAGGIVAVFEPRADRAAAITVPAEHGIFSARMMGDETYDVYLRNLPGDFYLAGVRVNGGDVMENGLSGAFASPERPFELVVDSRGGRVTGVVTGPDDNAWSGASLALIPDPARGKLQMYREGSADEYGRFTLRGVAPGDYILAAWLDDPPCDYYDAEGTGACRAAGMRITVAPAGLNNVILKMRK